MAPVRWAGMVRALDALVLTSGIWFLAKFVRFAFPPLFGTFQGQYGASPATLGLLFSLLLTVYAAMQFPSGAVADRVGSVRVIVAGVLVSGAAALGLGLTQAFAVLVAAMVLIGLGTGLHKTVAINLLGAVYPARTGRTLGTMDAIGSFGGVAAPAAVVAVLSTPWGWPGLFLAVGVASVALAVAFARRVPDRLPDRSQPAAGDETTAGSAGIRTYASALRTPYVAGFVVVVVANAFAFNGLVAFLPLYLESARGLATAQAGLLYATLFAVSLVQPLTGGLADRIGRYPLMIGCLGLAAIALAALRTAGAFLVVAGLVALIGLGGHGFRPVRDAHFVAVLPADAAGGSLGLARTVMLGAGAAAPAVVGAVTAATSYDVAFLLLALAFGLGAAVLVGLALVDGGAGARPTR